MKPERSEKAEISVALCTYNGAEFLSAQLESFLRQTRLPDEIVVCDDCSRDETVEILRKFAETAPFPVRIHVNEKNLRSTKNFEKAIGLCAGDLIFLSDQDDVWKPEKIARIEAEFNKNPRVGMVFSDAELVDENLQPLGRNLWSFSFSEESRVAARKDDFFNVLLSQNVVTGATMAFRAAFREAFTPIPENIPNLIHDAWISLVISGEARVVFLDEQLIKYRQHASQQLGIGFRRTEAKNFDERKNQYSVTIAFIKNEIERLKQMREVFENFPQFESKREKIDFTKLVEEKTARMEHLEVRMNLPSARTNRVSPVFREFLSGRYGRFSKGFLSAGKDLLEK